MVGGLHWGGEKVKYGEKCGLQMAVDGILWRLAGCSMRCSTGV